MAGSSLPGNSHGKAAAAGMAGSFPGVTLPTSQGQFGWLAGWLCVTPNTIPSQSNPPCLLSSYHHVHVFSFWCLTFVVGGTSHFCYFCPCLPLHFLLWYCAFAFAYLSACPTATRRHAVWLSWSFVWTRQGQVILLVRHHLACCCARLAAAPAVGILLPYSPFHLPYPPLIFCILQTWACCYRDFGQGMVAHGGGQAPWRRERTHLRWFYFSRRHHHHKTCCTRHPFHRRHARTSCHLRVASCPRKKNHFPIARFFSAQLALA